MLPPVAVGDDDLARGVALIDWGDRPPTAATNHSPAPPTVRRIASKREVRRRVPFAFPVITTTTATTAGEVTTKTFPASVLAVAQTPEAGRSTLVLVSAPWRRQPAAQKSWTHCWPPTGASFPWASARWTRNPPCGETHLAEAVASRTRTGLGRLGQRPSTYHRTPVRCSAATIAEATEAAIAFCLHPVGKFKRRRPDAEHNARAPTTAGRHHDAQERHMGRALARGDREPRHDEPLPLATSEWAVPPAPWPWRLPVKAGPCERATRAGRAHRTAITLLTVNMVEAVPFY